MTSTSIIIVVLKTRLSQHIMQDSTVKIVDFIRGQEVVKLSPKTRVIARVRNCEECVFYSIDPTQAIANRMLHQPNKFYCNKQKELISYQTHHLLTCLLKIEKETV